MGRYYNGDIEGKFWFGVQPSDDADFFGVDGIQPDILEYSFDEDNLEDIKKGINKCLKELGAYKNKLDTFFNTHNGYNDKEIADVLGIKEDKVLEILQWYARLELGNKILKQIQKDGYCTFEAEI